MIPIKKYGSDPVQDNQKLSAKEAAQQIKDANLKKQAEREEDDRDKDNKEN